MYVNTYINAFPLKRGWEGDLIVLSKNGKDSIGKIENLRVSILEYIKQP